MRYGRAGVRGIAAAALGLLSACGDGGGSSAPTPARPSRIFRVVTAPVSTRALSYSVQAIGSLEAYQTVTVPARVDGVVEKLDFEEGDAVTPEKVLAVIDGERYALEKAQTDAMVAKTQAAVAQAEAGVGQAEAQKASAAASLAEAKANLARREEVRRRTPGSVSAEEVAAFEAQVARLSAGVDEAEAQSSQAAAGVTQAKAAVDDAKARVALAVKNVADSRVRSPIPGTVESKAVATGQYVKVGAAIATLVDTRTLRLRFRVSEGESARVTKESPVTFRVQAMPDREFKAALFHMNGTADPVTRMVECVATVEAPDASLKPGFFAAVKIETGTAPTAIVVPEEAVLPSERGYVAYVVADGKAKQRTLTLGLRTKEGQVEILQGLAVGEALVVEGASILQDGVPVDAKAKGVASTPPPPATPGEPGGGAPSAGGSGR